MVMHTRGAGRRPQGRRDFVVLEALLRAEQEHFALQPRQLSQAEPQPSLRFSRHRPFVGIAVAGA